MAIKQTLIDFSKALKSAIQVQKNVTDIAADYLDKLSDENFDGVTPEEMEEITGDLDELTTTAKTNLVTAINEVKADMTKAKFITATSTTLSSSSGALGGYTGNVTISSSDVPSTTYAIIPLGCQQSTDGNRIGALRPHSNTPVNLTWFVNGGMPSTYMCMFIALYR